MSFQEMPKLIPTPRTGPIPTAANGGSGGTHHEEQDDFLSHGSHSNETSLPLNEDPMNLVETSWDISTSLHNGKQHSTSNETTGNGHSAPQQSSIPIKN